MLSHFPSNILWLAAFYYANLFLMVWREYNFWFTPTSSGMQLGRRKQWLGVIQFVLIFHDILHMLETKLMWRYVSKYSRKKEVYCLTKILIKQASNPSKNKWNYLILILLLLLLLLAILQDWNLYNNNTCPDLFSSNPLSSDYLPLTTVSNSDI